MAYFDHEKFINEKFNKLDFELKVLKQVVLKVDEYKEFLAEHPDSISKDYLHAVRDLTNELDEILRGDDND